MDNNTASLLRSIEAGGDVAVPETLPRDVTALWEPILALVVDAIPENSQTVAIGCDFIMPALAERASVVIGAILTKIPRESVCSQVYTLVRCVYDGFGFSSLEFVRSIGLRLIRCALSEVDFQFSLCDSSCHPGSNCNCFFIGFVVATLGCSVGDGHSGCVSLDAHRSVIRVMSHHFPNFCFSLESTKSAGSWLNVLDIILELARVSSNQAYCSGVMAGSCLAMKYHTEEGSARCGVELAYRLTCVDQTKWSDTFRDESLYEDIIEDSVRLLDVVDAKVPAVVALSAIDCSHDFTTMQPVLNWRLGLIRWSLWKSIPEVLYCIAQMTGASRARCVDLISLALRADGILTRKWIQCIGSPVQCIPRSASDPSQSEYAMNAIVYYGQVFVRLWESEDLEFRTLVAIHRLSLSMGFSGLIVWINYLRCEPEGVGMRASQDPRPQSYGRLFECLSKCSCSPDLPGAPSAQAEHRPACPVLDVTNGDTPSLCLQRFIDRLASVVAMSPICDPDEYQKVVLAAIDELVHLKDENVTPLRTVLCALFLCPGVTTITGLHTSGPKAQREVVLAKVLQLGSLVIAIERKNAQGANYSISRAFCVASSALVDAIRLLATRGAGEDALSTVSLQMATDHVASFAEFTLEHVPRCEDSMLCMRSSLRAWLSLPKSRMDLAGKEGKSGEEWLMGRSSRLCSLLLTGLSEAPQLTSEVAAALIEVGVELSSSSASDSVSGRAQQFGEVFAHAMLAASLSGGCYDLLVPLFQRASCSTIQASPAVQKSPAVSPSGRTEYAEGLFVKGLISLCSCELLGSASVALRGLMLNPANPMYHRLVAGELLATVLSLGKSTDRFGKKIFVSEALCAHTRSLGDFWSANSTQMMSSQSVPEFALYGKFLAVVSQLKFDFS